MVTHIKLPESAPATTDMLVLHPNVMGGTVEFTNGKPGDTDHRGNGILTELDKNGITNTTLLTYNRLDVEQVHAQPKRTFLLGLPAHLETSAYIQACAEQAKILQKTIEAIGATTLTAFGASAGAEHLLRLFNTDLLEAPDVAVLYDPPATQKRSTPGLLGHWLTHQLLREQRRPQAARNHHPMAQEDGGAPPISSLTDMAMMQEVWTGDGALEGLRRLADGTYKKASVGGTTTRFIVPGKTFTQTPAEAQLQCEALNQIAAKTQTDFQATVVKEFYHSAPDDPYICGKLVLYGLSILPAESALRYGTPGAEPEK